MVRVMMLALVFALTMGLSMTASAQEVSSPVVTAISAGSPEVAMRDMASVPNTLTRTLTVTPSTGIDEVDTMFGSLTDFLFGIVKIVGIVSVLFGIVQVGLSISNHDPSQRAQGFMFLAGGVIVFFAPEIIGFLTGGV